MLCILCLLCDLVYAFLLRKFEKNCNSIWKSSILCVMVNALYYFSVWKFMVREFVVM